MNITFPGHKCFLMEKGSSRLLTDYSLMEIGENIQV
ncbi:MAG: MBL fold metallo-hydrolase [Saprospiraceae bacterium]|nr:MBL fold metallo-hydrolase [Saprospiraceae bacterium]